MKKSFLSIVVVMFLAIIFHLEADSSSWEIQSVVLTERVWSKYVTVGGVNLHNTPTINNDVVTSLKNGLTVEIWHSAGLNDFNLSGDKGDEIDCVLAWGKKSPSLNINAGVIYLDFIPLSKKKGDKLRIFAEAGKTFSLANHQLSPFFRYEWNQPMIGKVPVAGSWIWIGGNDVWGLSQKTFLKIKAYLLYDNTKQEGVDAIFQPTLSWQAAKNFSIDIVCLKLYQPIWKSTDKKFEHVEGGGLTYKF
jgi:hypothetical protein